MLYHLSQEIVISVGGHPWGNQTYANGIKQDGLWLADIC